MNKSRSKPSTKRSEEDRIKISESIFEIYSLGGITIESACGEFGITSRTLWNWVASSSEISEGYKKAKDSASRFSKETIREKALDGLTRLITGGYIEEEETEEILNREGKIVRRITRKKKRYISPNPTAVIFALKNTDPHHFNDEINLELGVSEDQVFKIGDNEISFR